MVRARLLGVISLTCVLSAAYPAVPAMAFDLLGWIGLSDGEPPAATPTTLPYKLTIETGGADGAKSALRDASNLYRLRNDPPPDGDALARLAVADLPRLTDALWALGYYDARVTAVVAGRTLALATDQTAAAAAAANAYKGRGPVPVEIQVQPGPLYTFRTVRILDAKSFRPFTPQELPPKVVGLKPGDPARSAEVIAAESRIVDHFRDEGHPFAKMTGLDPVVDHPARAMDVSMSVAAGPKAGFGDISVAGETSVPESVIRSFIYTEPGDPYSPQTIDDMKKSIGRIEALSSVRIREGSSLDASGNLPLFVDVTERKLRAIGASALYSTIDGPEVRAYWTHRNLFGGAEVLRVEGSVFYAGRTYTEEPLESFRDFKMSDFGGRFGYVFMKPALWGSRNDLVSNASISREKTISYVARRAGGEIGIRHRFSDMFSVQGTVKFDRGQTSDELGQVTYTLVGLPVSVTYDSTDNALNPSKGWRITATEAPYPTFLGSTVGINVFKANASTYWSIDEDGRYILAARAGFGTVAGASLDEIPANYRFYGGGGGSVRGYKYQSLGPQVNGAPVGGRSLLEGSLEARIKITDTIGIVPFVDAGTAFESSLPDFEEPIRVSAGLGLRYYTPIGPIRVDVAVPFSQVAGNRPVALYIGVGQSF
jgi:translocation and assembly module TamA